jgi:hypothetical protein
VKKKLEVKALWSAKVKKEKFPGNGKGFLEPRKQKNIVNRKKIIK